ncbi:MAG: hypothetical protein ACI9U2_000760 [Bradymonadia bacterium]|jgi:hypothetical protein
MQKRLWALALLATAVACDDAGDNGGQGMAGDGAVRPIDMRVQTDMLVMPDMARPDMAAGFDMGADPDMAQSDMTVELDMARPDDGVVCVEAADCDDGQRCTDDACADGACANTPIVGCCEGDADCPEGACIESLNACADRAPVGGVVITEIMVDPTAVSDAVGEWFEVENVGDAPITLNGWTIDGADGDAHLIEADAPLVIEAGARFIFGRNADANVNGGVAVDYQFAGVSLTNSADRVALLDGFGDVVDAVSYDPSWPLSSGATLALDPGSIDAMANDNAANWCTGRAPWAMGGMAGDLGSPGAENPACVPPVELADWCRLQFPVDAEVGTGTDVTVYARINEPGITDATDATDIDPAVIVQVGFGVDGSDPAVEPWAWFAAEANAGWNAADAGEPGNDEYQATFVAPQPGTYDHAARVSVDGGDTWIYCDRAAGEGSDGAEDGYQIENAGSLVSVAAECLGVVCDAPPTARCEGNGVATSAAVGNCVITDDGVATCAYPEEVVDCGDLVCDDGECVEPAPLPLAGDIVIAEILYDPHGPLAEDAAEWFEIYNRTEDDLRLDGCRIADASNTEVIDRLNVPAGARLVFGRSADQAVNGGISIDHLFGFALNNGGDTVSITCGPLDAEVVIDTVTYDDGGDFPNAQRASISLDAGAQDAAANDEGANWCLGQAAYFSLDGMPEEDHLGTPGSPNPICPMPDVTVDWCRLQFPLDPVVGAGTQITIYGRVFEAGVTDRSPGVDLEDGFIGQAGIGAMGSVPGDDWHWIDAAPTPIGDGPLEPDNDEYQANTVVPPPGMYAFALRFSRDAGATWLYCDRDAGPGSDGAEDGYQIDNAGLLTSLAGACDDLICAAPPAPTCDGDTRVAFTVPGQCQPIEGEGVCLYPEGARRDCSLDGGLCDAGECVGGAAAPSIGDLVINEFMFDPGNGLSDNDAEWIEVLNTTEDAFNLEGCTLYDGANSQDIDQVLLIEPGAYMVFGKSLDAAVNGGIDAAFVFGFGLNQAGDTIGLRCADVLIDEIAYSAGNGFPREAARSVSLSDAAADNALGANWCLSTSDYYVNGDDPPLSNQGTPGAPNDDCVAPDACAPNPCDAPPVADCADVDTRRTYLAPGDCVDVRGLAECTYAEQLEACADGCEAGVCVIPGARGPAAGELVVNEIMYDPHHALGEPAAEWFELYNPTDEVLALDGCTVTENGGGALALDGLTVEAGGFLLFAGSADEAENGGLVVDGALPFSLGNGGDSLTIVCADVEIDAVAYDDGAAFPDARAHSISLADPASDNADGANWCLARAVYFADPSGDAALNNHGTPGAPNDACDELANFGVLQFPLAIDAQTDAVVIVYGRVYHLGITDRTGGVDVSALLRAQLGFGPDGSDPAVDEWTWINGAPNPDWDGPAIGEADNDEYQVALRLPAPGAYDYAWRFSADGGRTWVYADGAPGSSDGYQIENAGQMVSQPQLDLCDPNPCNTPPAPVCQDESTVLEASPEGICAVVDDAPTCDYDPQPVPCADGLACQDGACLEVLDGRVPGADEVVITELMYDPHFGLDENFSEWIELYNATDEILLLDGCVLSDRTGSSPLDGLQMQPNGYLLLARSADEALNGGLVVDGTFNVTLNNGGDTLTITCQDVEIDVVAYDDGGAFPNARAKSISLDPAQHAANEDGANWCLAFDVYYAPGDEAANHFGTPGAANPPCDELADFGRLQFPLFTDAPVTTVYGRVYHAGITDRSPSNDPSPRLVAELGYGADGSDPAVDAWTWVRGVPNAAYDGGGGAEPDNDEYQADLVLPELGQYDYAWRFSADGGRTWLYADGQGAGSSDGYQPENAGDANLAGPQ